MSFDKGQGVGRTTRAKAALESNIDRESVPGHWIWTGKVGEVLGYPIVTGREGNRPASRSVYHAYTGMVRPDGLERRCEHKLCVRPQCWSAR